MDVQPQVHSLARLHGSSSKSGTPSKAHLTPKRQTPCQGNAQSKSKSKHAHTPRETTQNGGDHTKPPSSLSIEDGGFNEHGSVEGKSNYATLPPPPLKAEDIAEEALRSGRYLVVYRDMKKPKECPECYRSLADPELLRLNLIRCSGLSSMSFV